MDAVVSAWVRFTEPPWERGLAYAETAVLMIGTLPARRHRRSSIGRVEVQPRRLPAEIQCIIAKPPESQREHAVPVFESIRAADTVSPDEEGRPSPARMK